MRGSATTGLAATTARSSPSGWGRGRGERTPPEGRGALARRRSPAGPLYSPQQALEDPHIRAAGLLQDTEYPGLPHPAPLAPTPVDLSETPGRLRRRAPTLGEHTDEILAELGDRADEIVAPRAEAVVSPAHRPGPR